MKNIEKSCEIVSEPRFKFKDAIVKIPGTTKDYLEFYSLVPVHYSLHLVWTRSINRQLSKYTSTLCYCRGGVGATVLTMLLPSLPSRWIKSPGGSQIKSFKVFFQDLPGKKPLEISFDWRQADFSKYYNITVYWHPCSREPLYTMYREPLQYKNGQTDRQTIINYSW